MRGERKTLNVQHYTLNVIDYGMEYFSDVGSYGYTDCRNIRHIGNNKKGTQYRGNGNDVACHSRYGRLYCHAMDGT